MPLISWLAGLIALCAAALGLAVLVDPAYFPPTTTDANVLLRRRILGASGLFLTACLFGVSTYFGVTISPSSEPDTGWLLGLDWFVNLSVGCGLIVLAIVVFAIWTGIARRVRARRRTNYR